MTHNLSEQPKIRAAVTISGRVQGVYFRASTKDMADQLGVTGWVRNLPNGDVAAVFEGPRDAVEQIIAWCHKGPREARVRNVTVEWGTFTGEFSEFSILR